MPKLVYIYIYKTEETKYHTLVRHMIPNADLDPLYSTRLLLSTTHLQDCGSSSPLLHDSRQEIYHPYNLNQVRGVHSMTIFGTASHSQSY